MHKQICINKSDGELYFQVQHFNKIKKFIQKLLYNGIATNKKQELMYELYPS